MVAVFGTWGKALGVLGVSGIDTDDGKITLAIAAIAGFCMWRHARSGGKLALVFAGLMGAAGTAIGIAYIDDFSSKGEFVTPGWGLYVLALASATLVGSSVVLGWRARKA